MPRADQPPEVKYKQNAGTPDQRPQGAAGDLNEGLAAVPDQEAAIVPEEEGELELALPEDNEPVYQPITDEDDFIFGATTRPNEPESFGAVSSRPLRPANVESWLPALDEAASALDAPPQVKALAKLVHYHLER